MLMFKRKAYDQLLNWKNTWNGQYACLLEGARRVGKTTIAEEFAKNEYKSYIKIDFSDVSEDILSAFDDISRLDNFFLKLQIETGVQLFKRESLIIFDEVQLYPRARQAIKHLVADGRYDYLGKYIIGSIPRCPLCKNKLDRETTHCDNCGQALDWSE